MLVVLVFVGRFKSRPVALGATWVMLVAVPVMALAPSVAFLTGGLITWAFLQQVWGTPVWVMQLEIERRHRRSMLGTFIACYSAGNLTGSGLSALAAGADLAPWIQLAGVSAVFGILFLITWRWLPQTKPHTVASKINFAHLVARFTPQLRLLASVRFLTIFMSNATGHWVAIYVAETLGGGPVLGAATYGAMAIANAAALLFVGDLLERFDRMLFFRVSTTAAAAAFGAALAFGTPVAALLGLVVVGLGTACIDPVVYGSAGAQPNLTAGEGVSVVEAGEIPAGFVSAALIGVLAGQFGLRIGLTPVVLALLGIAVLSRWLRAPASWTTAS